MNLTDENIAAIRKVPECTCEAEIVALCDKIAELQSERDTLAAFKTSVMAEVGTEPVNVMWDGGYHHKQSALHLAAKLVEAQKDVKRYRWIRTNGPDCIQYEIDECSIGTLQNNACDEAIDAAIAKPSGESTAKPGEKQ